MPTNFVVATKIVPMRIVQSVENAIKQNFNRNVCLSGKIAVIQQHQKQTNRTTKNDVYLNFM